jgi:S-adenosylmethionine synthetase
LPRVLDKLSQEMRYLFDDDLILYVNPTWKFVIWWPNGDTWLTWRKIIVDTYGWKWAHWWWAFSGKDPSKVDRSAAYAARHIAKNLVAAWVCDEALVQIAYAIWIAQPVSIFVDTYWKSKINMSDEDIAKKVWKIFDLRPKAIENRFHLCNPIYLETAAYGHMWRTPRKVTKIFSSQFLDKPIEKEVELFPREKLDYLETIKQEFWI